ncbi:MAG: hypothetical protein HY730_04300 [Candidatus Tectomicrobia bacterium]|uniref:Uncharacterized protein n=1 Tax=Tectimicrobiota bacterium TaxID=2528274 RepID=A0A933GLJ0_UNCTE|nr:hypothetical protein [Candidatus Tectomicrobia bacterium]
MLTVASVMTMGIEHRFNDLLDKEIRPALLRVFVMNEKLCDAFENNLSELFPLRMKMFYQLLREGEFDWQVAVEDLKKSVLELKQKIEAGGNIRLAENFAFASTVSIEIMESALEKAHIETPPRDQTDIFLKMTLEDFQNLILLEALPPLTRRNLIEITKTITLLDFAILLVFLSFEKILDVPQSKLEELSICLRDWAQLYGALAQELKLWKTEAIQQKTELGLSETDIIEAKRLAEAGIEDYLENVIKDKQSV